jgi:hypothetical protein
MFKSRRCVYFWMIVMTLFFSMQSVFAQEVNNSRQGEAELSTRPWQWGVFMQGGFPPKYHITTYAYSNDRVNFDLKLQLFSAGLEVGKQTRRFDGPRPLRGRGEAMLEVMPFWLGRYPTQTITINGTADKIAPVMYFNGEDFHGASITPFLLRWNFSQRDSARIVPWAQLGGGLLWTNHKFPYSYFGGTSVINFTPQVGAGVNIFNRPKHSINLAMKAIHISNASLGDHNPGLNQTLQFSLGYSWWR